MPLELLLVLVIGGIAGIALLLHLDGQSTQRRFADPQEALTLWHEALPDLPAEQATVARAGHTALIRHRDGLGVIWAMGQDVAARPLPRGAVHLSEEADCLTLHLPDFTAPHVRVRLDPDERSVWRKTLQEVTA